MVHLQGESFLQAADRGITASSGAGSCRFLPLELASAAAAGAAGVEPATANHTCTFLGAMS